MKFLLISQNYAPEGGAASIRLTTMVNALKERGLSFDVLSAMPNYPKGIIYDEYKGNIYKHDIINDIHVYRYWIMANNSYNKYLRFIAMISMAVCMSFFFFKRNKMKEYEAVVIQSPQLLLAFVTMFICKFVYKKKIILNVSDIHPSSLVDSKIVIEGSLYHKILCYFERKIYHWSSYYMGQSNEILSHIKKYEDKPSFLYRTLQKLSNINVSTLDSKSSCIHNKLVYAGLLGKTQDLVAILKNVEFKKLCVEFHIYGDGGQRDEVIELCDNINTFYHGSLPSSQMNTELKKYHASIIPLSTAIFGAVPSKIYNVIASGLPVLYLGKKDGEAANIIRKYKVGYVSPSYDFDSLQNNIERFTKLSKDDYVHLVDNCNHVTSNELNFEKQLDRLVIFLSNI